MASLFLLPKGSNFHLRQHISYISFGNHGQLDDFPLFSLREHPALSQTEMPDSSVSLYTGNLWPKLCPAIWDCTSHVVMKLGWSLNARKEPLPRVHLGLSIFGGKDRLLTNFSEG